MIGYAEREVFTKSEMRLLVEATKLVAFVPYDIKGEPVRCHELARAVGKKLGLEVVDGRFGFVEHSWLWTTPFAGSIPPWTIPNILDVYVPGRSPQVQLVHTASSGLPTCYALNPIQNLVVSDDVVERLLWMMS